MDERARAICAKAFDTLDRVDAMQAEPQPALSFDEQYEIEAQEADLFLERCAERRRESEQEPEERERMSLKATIAMIDAAEVRARAFAVAAAEALGTVVGEATGKLESRIKKMEDEIAALKCDLQIVEAHKASKSDVVPLRDRNVA
jgi:hypothetical protein